MEKNQHLTRQMDIIPMDVLGENITIIGAGAIGSFTCLALAKMGFSSITVIDYDEVSAENMSCQWYRHGDIGKQKVTALAEIIKDFTGTEIDARDECYTGGAFNGIVISAVDNMETRKLIWGNHSNFFGTRYVIDPRMASEYATMYTMCPYSDKDKESYENTMFTDAEGVQEKCTAKSTMYTAQMISGLVAKSVKDILTTGQYPRVVQWDIKNNKYLGWNNGEH